MTNRVDDLKIWLNVRTIREKGFIFGIGFVLIYLMFNSIFIQPLEKSRKITLAEMDKTKAEIDAVDNQIKAIFTTISQPGYSDILSQSRQLEKKSKAINQHLLTAKPNFLQLKDYEKAVKDILSAQGNVAIISIKKLPNEPLISKEINQANIADSFKTADKYTLEIQFRSDYFNTIAYLQRLEKLPWYLYWDSLQYKVTNYPTADIIIKLHLLVSEKSVQG